MIDFVAIDFETANANRSSICQIGLTEVVDGKPQPPKSWYVRPEGNEYSRFNIAVHGITPDVTENSPSFTEVWQEVRPYLDGKIVVAHNTSFDMYALRDALMENHLEFPTFDYFCTLRLSRYVIKGCYSYSLETVLEYLDVDLDDFHQADVDSFGCAVLMMVCLEKAKCSLEELEEKFNFHRGKFAPDLFRACVPHAKKHPTTKQMLDSLESHPELIDEGNYFYGKAVCFTGKCLYGTRAELLQQIKNIGGIPMDSVTKKTEVLVVGQQDYRIVGSEGMSSKQKKAFALLEQGQDIEILSEQEFLCRI